MQLVVMMAVRKVVWKAEKKGWKTAEQLVVQSADNSAELMGFQMVGMLVD